MTHKATLVSLHRLALAGLAESALPRERIVKLRRFFVTSEINDLLSGRVQANPEFPCGKASHQIGIFVRGNIVGVSRTHKSKCELKWLDGHDEAWVFSIREPRPGWRIFGRFASKNVFVGLHCVTREEAGDLIGYAKQVSIMIEKWEKLFPGMQPFSGSCFEDYLGDWVVER